jgi:hypothetical protein
MSTQDRSSDFYLTSYRAWEFLGGSLLAWWHYGKNHDGKNHEEEAPYANMLSIAGAVLLVLSMILLKEGQPYPGWRGVFPVVGSIALIAAGKQSWINRVVLSNPVVVWIGLISYPLYLFHWPALSFVHIVKGEKPADIYLAAALVITFVLTVATYYLIEKPIRSHRSKLVVPILSIAFLLTGVLGLLTWQNVIHKSHRGDLALVDHAINDKFFWEGYAQTNNKTAFPLYKTGGNGPQTVFFGDSNMQQYAPRIRELTREISPETKERGAIFVTIGGIPPIPGYFMYGRKESPQLMNMFEEVIKNDSRVDTVVIAALWRGYFKKPSKSTINGMPVDGPDGKVQVFKSLGDLVHGLVANGKKVYVVLSVPSGSELDPLAKIDRGFGGIRMFPQKKLSAEKYLEKNGKLLDEIRQIAVQNGAQVIDPLEYLSEQGYCTALDESGPIRYDACHLRPGFAREKLKYLDQTIMP